MQTTNAESVVNMVRSRFPTDPISISGTITVRRMRGVVLKELGYSIDASWRDHGGTFKCMFTDAMGRESDAMEISFEDSGKPVIKREAGVTGGLVDDAGHVLDTALDCSDLTMPFLWWAVKGEMGRETSRGRDCLVIDFESPGENGLGRVRAWIDSAIFIVLRAESYDTDDTLVKQVVVKSFKKIEDQWIIKDLEISEASATVKTVVTVEGMDVKTKSGGKKDI